MYGLIGKMNAVPGQRDALAAILLDGTQAMPGCLSYVIARDPADDECPLDHGGMGQSGESQSVALAAVGAGRHREGPSDDRRLQQSRRDRTPRRTWNLALMSPSMNRREALAALVSTATLPLISGCMPEPTPASTGTTEADALALLDQIADNLLRLDTGGRDVSGHRYRRESGSAIATHGSLGAGTAADRQPGSRRPGAGQGGRTRPGSRTRRAPASRSSRSAYATSLEGFALPYGDVAVGGWRNTPYVVIQNVGAYLDIPRFLDAEHRVENAADAEAYLARLQSYAKQLDGELGRIQAARAAGLVPPGFLIDKALAQMTLSAKNAREGGVLVESLERRVKNIPGTGPTARARSRRRRSRPRSIGS